MTCVKLAVLAVITAFACGLATPEPAFAQGDAQKKKALSLYDEATKKYNIGEWEDAIRLYKDAYDAYPAAEFLFNIGQSYRQTGDCRNALFFYKRYLANKPDAPNREQVEGFIKELETSCTQGSTTGTGTTGTGTGTTTTGTTGTGTGTTTTGTGTTATGTGTTTTGTGTTTTGTGTTTTGTGTTTTGTTGTGALVESGGASTTQNLQGSGTDASASSATSGGSVSTAAEAAAPSLIAVDAQAGIGIVEMGELDTTSQLSIKLGAGYPLPVGPVTLELGAAATITTLQWENDVMDTGTSYLWSVLANARAVYPIASGLSVGGELGVGLLTFSGLADEAARIFLEPGMVADGSPSMLNVRVAIGVEYLVAPGLSATLHPLVLAMSPAKEGFREDIETINRLDFLLGIAYKL